MTMKDPTLYHILVDLRKREAEFPHDARLIRKLRAQVEEFYLDSDDRERQRLLPKIADTMEGLSEEALWYVTDCFEDWMHQDKLARLLRNVGQAVKNDRLPPGHRPSPGWRKGLYMPDPNYPRRKRRRVRRRSLR